MARLLVVEDSPGQARLIQAMLESAGHEVRLAADGREGLRATDEFSPAVVLTDLQMPEMGGLELVGALRRKHPALPVVLMTAFGSEDVAMEALKRGAASYVPKKQLAQSLLGTVQDLLSIAHGVCSTGPLPFLARCEMNFVLENDPAVLPALTSHFHNALLQIPPWSENTLMRLEIALHEAVVNAIYHGNLEISSEHRTQDDAHFELLVEQRRRLTPFADRKVVINARVSRYEAVISVSDEGPGFDRSLVANPTDPAHLEKLSGRGLFLIHTFLDEVHYNARGNEITMLKRREALPATA